MSHFGPPPHYRNVSTGRVETLPFRVVMPDGTTRTNPDEWQNDAAVLAAAGYELTTITPEDEATAEAKALAASMPSTVSARQIRLWLVGHGVTLEAVDAAIDAIPDQAQRTMTRIEWEFAPYVERSHPLLNRLAAALGLDEAAVNQAFREAAAL